jgi:flagellar hook-length control protein FliK
MQGCAMPVAISFSDPVNSAAQFMDGAAKGDAASSATSQAFDPNSSAASLFSKDGKPSDEDFDAVLALLLNGGVPVLQPPVVQVKVETNAAESGTSDATITLFETAPIGARDSSTAGDADFVNLGQLLLRRDSVAQQMSATPGIGITSKAISENAATTDTAESAIVPGVSLASTTAGAIASPDLPLNSANVDDAPTAKMQAGQGSAPSQAPEIADDEEIFPTQIPANQTRESQIPSTPELPTQELLIYGVDTNVADITIPIYVSVSAPPLESVTAKPLSSDMIQALERIGQPLDSGIDSDQGAQSQVPAAESQISSLPKSGLLTAETQAATASQSVPKPILVAVPTTATAPSVESSKAATNQQPPSTSELHARVSSLTGSTSNSAEKLLRPFLSESSEADTGITTTIKSFESAPDGTTLTSDLTSSASEPLQPSVASLKRRGFPDEDPLVLDDSKPQLNPASDVTAATQQNGFVSSVLPNSVPDLAASISAEMRQPLTSQVSQAIMDHVERHGVRQSDSLSVRLDPPELGEMTIQLSKTDEGLAVRVTAREAVTMDMLFARGQEIESQLRGQRMNLKSLEFQRTDMSSSGFSHGQGQPQQQNNSSRRSENLLNQIRGGTRSLSLNSNSHPRSVTSESNYGLSFRA